MKLGDDVRIPEGSEERAWQVVRAAYDERIPSPRERRPLRPALALAAALVVIGAAISPPGQAVLDSIRETVGVEKAQPALFRLPAAGRLLVSSQAGAWVVDADGSKRRLGDWQQASWSPFGRFVVVARGNKLAAVEPNGDVHWKLSRKYVRLPRWGGTRIDTRIAYLSGSVLRVVAGDGRNDHRVARQARPVGLAWRPGPAHVLAYARGDGFIRVVDSDRGTVLLKKPIPEEPLALDWVADRLLVLTRTTLRLYDDSGGVVLRRRGSFTAAALAPRAQGVAVVHREGSVSTVDVLSRRGPARRAFAGIGRFDTLVWSPDGRWLLVGWPAADQWVFVRVTGPRRIVAVSNVSRQFDSDSFPRIAGWCCASS